MRAVQLQAAKTSGTPLPEAKPPSLLPVMTGCLALEPAAMAQQSAPQLLAIPLASSQTLHQRPLPLASATAQCVPPALLPCCNNCAHARLSFAYQVDGNLVRFSNFAVTASAWNRCCCCLFMLSERLRCIDAAIRPLCTAECTRP